MPRGRNKCECGTLYDYNATHCPMCGVIEAFSNWEPWNVRDWIYDSETFPNVYQIGFKHAATQSYVKFQLPYDWEALISFLILLRDTGSRLVGFNNINFDYPILHTIMTSDRELTAYETYALSQAIINSNDKFGHIVPHWKIIIPQIDLYLIHHFDNEAKRTPLKVIEFNMRMDSIVDMPYPHGTLLTPEQTGVLGDYMGHDINATLMFYQKSIAEIEFRESLGEKFLNFNDTKIGKQILIDALEEAQPGSCYVKSPITGKRIPRQTVYNSPIPLHDVVFSYIKFNNPEFQRVCNFFKAQHVHPDFFREVFSDLSCVVHGLEFFFGAGGIHASVNNKVFESNATHQIIDVDVGGYYPSLAIANRIYPAHLGDLWHIKQAELKAKRQVAKKTGDKITDKALKLALNGSFGDTNNIYSPFYDVRYMLQITINGQLLLCMLVEQLIKIPRLELIQANTDGVTAFCPVEHVGWFNEICNWWEKFTLLELERVNYRKMWIRDVNNYVAAPVEKEVKRKGAYEYKLAWHQNHSALVVPKVAEKVLLENGDPEALVRLHQDIHDFALVYKCPRGSTMWAGGVEQQRVNRYFVTTDGGNFFKLSPPPEGFECGQWKCKNGVSRYSYYNIYNSLPIVGPDYEPNVVREYREMFPGKRIPAKFANLIGCDVNGRPWDESINTLNGSKYDDRRTDVVSGRLVSVVNKMRPVNIDYSWYIAEVKKLVEIFK